MLLLKIISSSELFPNDDKFFLRVNDEGYEDLMKDYYKNEEKNINKIRKWSINFMKIDEHFDGRMYFKNENNILLIIQ